MHRVLKDGGILRISVPDFDKLVSTYHAEGDDIETINYYLMGNQDYAYNYHKSIFGRSYLARLMSEIGFAEIREWDAQTSEHRNYKDESTASISGKSGTRYFISLNLEAIK
jgi:predicted SAM-dependent methyltransferase